MKTHTVKAGDCMLSIATDNGFYWETLWDHPRNAKLRQKREDPFQLVEGDQVFVPDIQERPLRGSTGNRHTVRIKGIPASVQVQVFGDGHEPMSDQPFVLEVGGKKIEGRTTGDGVVQAFVPHGEKTAKLTVGEGEHAVKLDLAIGHLDPPGETKGVQGRLANLGFYSGEIDGKESDDLARAITAFQLHAGLEPTGALDEKTRAALEDQHGG